MFYNLLRRTLLENTQNNYNQSKGMEFQQVFQTHFQASSLSCLQERNLIHFYNTHSETMSSLIRKQKYRTSGEVNIRLLESIIRILAEVICEQGCKFSEILVMINNIVTLSNEKICYLISNQNVINRICHEFKTFNDNYQVLKLSDSLTKNEESQMNFNLYSNLHLLLNLLSQQNKLTEESYLSEKLFHRQIITSFLEIDLSEIKNNQIHKLCCGILSYFVKKVDLTKWGSLFKKYILNSLDYLTFKNKQAIVNSLRKIIRIQGIKKEQINKYKLLSFIVKSLEGEIDTHYFNNLLQICLIIIKMFPESCEILYNLNFVPTLIKLYPQEESLAIAILEKLVCFMNSSESEIYFQYFLKSFSTKSFNKYITKCLTSLVGKLEGMTIIRAVENNLIEIIGDQLKIFPTFTSVSMLLDFYCKILNKVKGWSEGFFGTIYDRIQTTNGIIELEENHIEFRCLINKFKITYQY